MVEKKTFMYASSHEFPFSHNFPFLSCHIDRLLALLIRMRVFLANSMNRVVEFANGLNY